MIKRLVLLFIAVWIFGCNSGDRTEEPSSDIEPAILYFGGTIIPMSGPAGESIDAVVTRGKTILYAGTLEGAQKDYASAQKVDLDGKVLMPGFIEQHLHPFLGALTLSMPVIAPEAWELPEKTWPAATSGEDYIAKLKEVEAAMADDSELLWTWGYHHNFHGELNRELLNSINDERPIGVWHRSCHEFYANDAFLDRYGINAEDVSQASAIAQKQIDLDKGHFYENGAIVYLLPKIVSELADRTRMERGLKQMVTMLHHNGVTAFNEPGAFIDPNTVDLYTDILGGPESPMYAYFIPEGNTTFMQHGDSSLFVVEEIKTLLPLTGKIRFFDDQIKFLADGAIISQLMQMKDGYLDGHSGEWMLEPELLEKGTRLFWDAGYQIHIHVNGDEGLEVVLETIERRMAENPREDHRTVIVHYANSTPEQVDKLAALGCIVSANPYYVTGFSDKFSEVGLGPERAQSMVRLAPVIRAGVPVSLHSDLPMAPSDPLYLAWSAVNRITHEGNVYRPDLALTVHQAMRAITIDAAQSWQMEAELGSIEAGKVANFTILGANPYDVDPMELKDIPILSTVFEGKAYPID